MVTDQLTGGAIPDFTGLGIPDLYPTPVDANHVDFYTDRVPVASTPTHDMYIIQSVVMRNRGRPPKFM